MLFIVYHVYHNTAYFSSGQLLLFAYAQNNYFDYHQTLQVSGSFQ